MKKTLRYKSLGTILLLTCSILIVGCKSKKVSVVDNSGTLKSKSYNEVVSDVLTHELDYNTITTKGKVSLNGKEVTTIFKLVKDEFIQASIRPILGIEAMRVDVTPEKAIFIDRLGGRYAEVRFDDPEISSLVAFNFYNLQALLTNKLFIGGRNSVDKGDFPDFDISVFDNNYILTAEDKSNLKYTFSVDASERITSTTILHSKEEAFLLWTYSDFVEDNSHIYPTTMEATAKIKKNNIKVNISYSDLGINTTFNLDKSISSRYQKVEILDLINAYMKLK